MGRRVFAAVFIGLAASCALGAGVRVAADAQQGSVIGQCPAPPAEFVGDRIDLTVTSRLKIDREAVIPTANLDILEAVRDECQTTAPDFVPPPPEAAGGFSRRPRPGRAKPMPVSAPGYMCVGEASLRLAASIAREKNYAAALCAFSRAETLADRVGPAAAALSVDAEDKRARTASEWSAYIGGQSEQARALRLEAVRALESAAARAPSPARSAALFDAYMAAGLDDKAEAQINALPAQDAGTARALVQLALYRLDVKKAPAATIRPLLPRIQSAAPQSVYANAAVGELYRLMGDDEAALRAFNAANAPGAVDDGDRDARTAIYNLAFARFRLAEFAARAARTGSDWSRVRELALASLKAGGDDSDFYVPLCLAHVALGGKDVRDGANSDWCEKKSTALGQAELLRGLYSLKRAQCFANFKFVAGREPGADEVRWREYVRNAEQAFENGRDLLDETPANLSDAEKAVRADRRRLLKQGSQTAQWMLGYCRAAEQPADQGQNALFQRLGLVSCLPNDPPGGLQSSLPGGQLCALDTQP